MTDEEISKFRELFIKRMTIDSKEKDRRKRGYNQAIFHKYDCVFSDGQYHQNFTDTTMEMVLDKFDLAVKDMRKGTGVL